MIRAVHTKAPEMAWAPVVCRKVGGSSSSTCVAFSVTFIDIRSVGRLDVNGTADDAVVLELDVLMPAVREFRRVN